MLRRAVVTGMMMKEASTLIEKKEDGMKTFKGRTAGLAFLSAMIFFLAYADLSAAGQQDPLQKLYEAAKPEKEVVWQWATAITEVTPIIEAFRKKYPDIKLSTISIGAATIGTRIIVESSAKQLTVDVGTALATYILPVIERDLLARYNWAQMVDMDPKRILFDGRFISYADSPRVWVYNTKLVSKAEAPKTWENTLAPKWKGGKIAVRAAPSGFAWLFPAWKQDKKRVIDYLNRLAKQDVVPGTRDAEVANRIATGESPIGTISMVSVMPALKAGAPLALCPIGPTASDYDGFWIPKGAPHPNAAKFFLAWMASREGTKEFLKAERGGPSYPPEASPQAKLLADSGVGFVPIASPEDLREYLGPFSDTVMKIMQFIPK
jgi:iron(III) transport system substrate-binding protein